MIIFYILTLFCLFIYSFALIDPNLTLINSQWWLHFRNFMVDLGYYQRELSSRIYIVIITLLFFLHYFFVKNSKRYNPLTLAYVTGAVLLFSYPFLSHDFFNYIFDAKIFTFYHQNPYLFSPGHYPQDEWLRFMHWTHRTYPYGPTFLVLTIIPSFLSAGKFLLNYLLFKLLFIAFYILGVRALSKVDRVSAMLFATSPLVIIEGLVVAHNDLIATSIALVGTVFLYSKKYVGARMLYLLSAGIKYMTFPVIFLSKNAKTNVIALAGIGMVLLYLALKSEIQPWYFLVLFALLPFYKKLIFSMNIVFAGLLFSYYPYIRLGGWDTQDKVDMKHAVMIVFLLINAIFLGYLFVKNRKSDFLKDVI